MNKRILHGLLIVYGVYVAIDMFLRIRRENKPIAQSFLESAMLPVHVAGTTTQLVLQPNKWGSAAAIVVDTAKAMFTSGDAASTLDKGYDALIELTRAQPTSKATIELPQPPINNPEIVTQADAPVTDPRYIGSR